MANPRKTKASKPQNRGRKTKKAVKRSAKKLRTAPKTPRKDKRKPGPPSPQQAGKSGSAVKGIRRTTPTKRVAEIFDISVKTLMKWVKRGCPHGKMLGTQDTGKRLKRRF